MGCTSYDREDQYELANKQGLELTDLRILLLYSAHFIQFKEENSTREYYPHDFIYKLCIIQVALRLS